MAIGTIIFRQNVNGKARRVLTPLLKVIHHHIVHH